VILKTATLNFPPVEMPGLELASLDVGRFAPTGMKHALPGACLIQEFFWQWNRRDGGIAKAQRLQHGMLLRVPSKKVNRTLSAERRSVVKNYAHTGTGGFQSCENPGKSQGETALRPSQGRVLHGSGSTPTLCPVPKRTYGAPPPAFMPGHPLDDQLEVFRQERLAKVAAILFDRVHGRVRPSKKRDDSRPAHFSTRKLPITSAFIPELKNVRIASVGVCTMASPRRLNDVFMITGTPVRFPNSSINRQ